MRDLDIWILTWVEENLFKLIQHRGAVALLTRPWVGEDVFFVFFSFLLFQNFLQIPLAQHFDYFN